MKYLTDFADQAVIIPLVLTVTVTLFMQGWRRGAIAWLVIVSGTFLATLGFKLMFLACSPVLGPADIHSPSGHVAAATVVAGGLAAMLTQRRNSILPAALVAACVIGLSRLVLGMHSLPEVIVGALIGLAGAAALMHYAGRPPALNLRPMIAAIVVVAVMFHGEHMPAEAAIRRAALAVAKSISACRGPPDFHWQDDGSRHM